MHKVLSLGVLMFLSGCATVMQGGQDRVYVTSKPEGARVYLDNQAVGTTPTIVTVPKTSEGVFRLEKEGYQPVTVDRDKVCSGWIFGNLLIGGVVGFVIDFATSNQGHYQDHPIQADLRAAETRRVSSQKKP